MAKELFISQVIKNPTQSTVVVKAAVNKANITTSQTDCNFHKTHKLYVKQN